MAKKEFDIVVYGASGFTGSLVAEYLTLRKIKNWAMAGRDQDKLARVRNEIGAPESIRLIEANANAKSSLVKMCESTKTVLTTVGPYQLYGNELLEVCAQTGTNYIDLCGEPSWMHEMLGKYEATARRTGAKIVFSAGFDSIPSDLGVWYLQQEAIKKFGGPAARVKCRVRKMKGSASGGTMASMKATLKASIKDPGVLKVLNNPFALTPGFEGPSQPSGLIPEYDNDAGVWSAPFVMAPINTKNVHRSNYLLNHLYGKDFVYDEMVYTTLADAGKAVLDAVAQANPFAGKGLKPGDGPSKEERENGYYEYLLIGELANGAKIKAVVTGDRDPGYGSTSKIISEAAICLNEIKSDGGFFTPAALMAEPLLERLVKYAGLTFGIEK